MTKTGVLSVVVPLYNEQETIVFLHERLVDVLKTIGRSFEIIFVDDGSSDDSFSSMKALQPLIAIRLKRNSGQTRALAVGIKQSRGNVVILLDGDLENDPADIPQLLRKFEDGFDVVSGWRQNRWKDKFFTRRLPSALANKFISLVSGVRLHDHGCTLKVYRREVLTSLNFTGDMHRMIAAYAARNGARVTELPVRFEPRKAGKSKYGLSRTFTVILDVLSFHFFYKYARRPNHFFGGIGFFALFFGATAFLLMLYLKYIKGVSFIQTPLPVLSALFMMVGFQFVLMGLLAEIFVRLHSVDDDVIEEIIEQ